MRIGRTSAPPIGNQARRQRGGGAAPPLYFWLACGVIASAPQLQARATVVDTDTEAWRASHDALIAIARAGDRLVAVGDRGHVLLSDDDGASWRLRQAPTEELLTAVAFTSPREGWAVGQDELALHTTDAGETWTVQHSTPNADQALFSVTVIAAGHLFASGAYNLTLETMDGSHWTEGKIPDLDDDYHLNCAVARGDDLLVTGESGHAFLRRAGAWTKMPVPYDGSQFGCLLGRDGSLYSFGLRGSLFRAAPGATNWVRIATGGERSIFGGIMLANGRIALVGATGLVLILDPALGTVASIPSSTDQALSGVAEARGGRLVVVGDDGVHLIDPATPVKQAEKDATP